MSPHVCKEDLILVKQLRKEKKWGAKRLCKEFPNKGWCVRTINRILSKVDNSGDITRKIGSGRPRSSRTSANVTATEDLVLSQEEHPGTHQSQREVALQLGVSQPSVHRIIKRDLKLSCFRKFNVEDLTEGERQRRVERAELLLARYPDGASLRRARMWFSDESVFTINRKVNKQNDRVYSRRPDDRRRDVSPARTEVVSRAHGGRIMVGACVSQVGKTELVFIDSSVRLDQYKYREMLEENYFPDIRARCGDNWTFQQDGATCHTARSVRDYLDHACPRYLKPEVWPPKSPDLNPMDFFVWGELERLVYRGVKIRDLDHLKERLQLCWAQISQRQVAKAIAAVPKRLEACITSRGGRFEHRL